MAQATPPTLLQVSAAVPARQAAAARSAPADGGGEDQAFAKVLDQHLKPGSTPRPDNGGQAAQTNRRDKTSPPATPGAAEAQASDKRRQDSIAQSQAETPTDTSQAAGADLEDRAALRTDEAEDTAALDPSAADTLQASLAGLPAALAALLAGTGNPGKTETPGETPPVQPATRDLAKLLGESLSSRKEATAATVDGDELSNTSASSHGVAGDGDTFRAMLEGATNRGDVKTVLSAVETESGPASRASEVAQLAANPEAGDAAATRSEPNPATGLPWTTPAARANQEDIGLRLHVTQPPSHPAWAEAVGSRVTWMVGQQESKAELVLTPPQLGRIEVTVTVNGDQTTAQFVAATAAAREALEQALPRLREVLADAGITLADSGVSTSDQQGAGGETAGQGRHRHAGSVSPGSDVSATTKSWLQRGQGLVDTFA